MKAILLAIRSEWLAKILNGEKTIEVRRRFPKDYVGWVYIYCSKGNDRLWKENDHYWHSTKVRATQNDLNGKVVARFWCDKVEGIELWYSPARADNCVDYDEWYYETETLDEDDLLYRSCLSPEQLTNYLCRKDNSNGFAIHISKLEIFDEPRELKYFHYRKLFHRNEPDEEGRKTFKALIQLSKAPQNLCYVEEE